MKQSLLITTLALLTTFSAAAQGPRHRNDGGGGTETSGDRTTRRLDYLTGYLSLTEAQRAQAQTIFTAADTASETARGQLTAARDALNTAIRANAPDAELDRLAAAVGTIEGQLTAIQAKASARFYALLTAEQRTRYDQRGRGGR